MTTKKTPVKKEAVKKTSKPVAKKATPKKTILKNEKLPQLAEMIVQILEDGKAANILSIDLAGKTSLTDNLIIASGTSTRHVLALASTLGEKLKDAGYSPKMDGRQGGGEWVVLDVGDAIVHIFVPETRLFYEIESLWGEKTPVA